jgi:lipopolysaccharide transport system permease protein
MPATDVRSDALPVHAIGPRQGGTPWRELWRYRELLYFLAWREVKLRYRQTLLGVLWVVLQPLVTMLIFAVLFGRFAGLESRTGGVPYGLYVFLGLMPWMFFSNAVTNSAFSLVANVNLVTKVYFPRLLIPLSAVGAGLVDAAISSALVLLLAIGFGVTPAPTTVLMPLFVIGVAVTATGVGALFSALTVAYRDVRYALPFLMQCWMFVTPVIYPASLVPERWRWGLYLNPLAGYIGGVRAAVLGQPIVWSEIALSVALSVVVLLAGAAYFRRVERSFADVI